MGSVFGSGPDPTKYTIHQCQDGSQIAISIMCKKSLPCKHSTQVNTTGFWTTGPNNGRGIKKWFVSRNETVPQHFSRY